MPSGVRVRVPSRVPTSSHPNPPQSKQAGMRFQMLNNAHPPGWALFVLWSPWARRQRWAVWSGCQAEPRAVGGAHGQRRAGSGCGGGPVLTPCRRPVPMKTSMSSILIFVPPLAAWAQGQPVDRPAPHPHLRKTSTALRWVVPLISGHQRPAAAGDFRPRIT